MLRVGLTGSIAVGKSFVLSVFKELGCVVFDADQIAHECMAPGRPAYIDLIEEFGSGILGEAGAVDRGKLGLIVFQDESRRRRLNEIVHPRVKEEQDRLLQEAAASRPDGIAIVDAALIIESGGYKRFDKLVVVFCAPDIQVQRLMARNKIDREDAERRIRAQMSSDEKRRYADFEIDTSSGFEDTRSRTIEVYNELRQKRSSH
ncbi:MAG TPA: dephospho-CoA kinase [Blastocatellia bacterium]